LTVRWANKLTVAKPWFNSRCGSASLCPCWKRRLMAFYLGAKQFTRRCSPVRQKMYKQDSAPCWSGKTDLDRHKA